MALAEKTEQLSACDKVHDHVQVADVLEGAPEVDEEWVTDADEHLTLRVGVLDLLHLDDLFLVEDLDGVESTVVARADQVDTTKRASAEAETSESRGRRGA